MTKLFRNKFIQKSYPERVSCDHASEIIAIYPFIEHYIYTLLHAKVYALKISQQMAFNQSFFLVLVLLASS